MSPGCSMKPTNRRRRNSDFSRRIRCGARRRCAPGFPALPKPPRRSPVNQRMTLARAGAPAEQCRQLPADRRRKHRPEHVGGGEIGDHLGDALLTVDVRAMARARTTPQPAPAPCRMRPASNIGRLAAAMQLAAPQVNNARPPRSTRLRP